MQIIRDVSRTISKLVKKSNNPKVNIRTYGCQMNEHDSEVIAGLLSRQGYEIVDDGEGADIYILNTCSVREHAEDRVRGRINLLSMRKRGGGKALIVLCGCMAQSKGSHILRELPALDVVCGTHRIPELPAMIGESLRTGAKLVDTSEEVFLCSSQLPRIRESSIKAWVSIMRGCDNFCSYCVVPYVRGREISRPAGDILGEIEGLVKDGYKEVTLLGQNVNSYRGRIPDEESSCDFVRLLELVNDIEGLERIRFVTSHPKDVSDELPGAITRLERICEHIHLPVQSGSNTVLERMNRNYTRKLYLGIIERLRKKVPGIAITTDIIVGFPGETDLEFRDTMSLMEEVQFDGAFIFKYSTRPQTAASRMRDTVPIELKKERLRLLSDLQMEISREKNHALIGKTVEVLVEGSSPKDPSKLIGRTRDHRIAVFTGGREDIGKIVNPLVTDANATTLYCRKIQE